MKKVAETSSGKCTIFLDRKDHTHSRLVKVSDDKSYHQDMRLLIDYETVLLTELWKYHDEVNPDHKYIMGWSVLPTLDNEGGLHVKSRSNNGKIGGKDVTSDFVPLVQFLERTKIDAKAALLISYQVVAFVAILDRMGFNISFQADKWLINPDDLRMVTCDLSVAYYCCNRRDHGKEHTTKDLVTVLRTAIVPYDDDFADAVTLFNNIASSNSLYYETTLDEIYYYLRRADYYCYIQKDGGWQKCRTDLFKLDFDDLKRYCRSEIAFYFFNLSRWAVFSGSTWFDDVYVVSIGYGLEQLYLPKSLATENLTEFIDTTRRYDNVDTQALANYMRSFDSICTEHGDRDNWMIIYTNQPLGDLPEPENSDKSLIEIVSDLNYYDNVRVYVTDESIKNSWRRYFGNKHVSVTSEEKLCERVKKLFSHEYEWRSFQELYRDQDVKAVSELLKKTMRLSEHDYKLPTHHWNWNYYQDKEDDYGTEQN